MKAVRDLKKDVVAARHFLHKYKLIDLSKSEITQILASNNASVK